MPDATLNKDTDFRICIADTVFRIQSIYDCAYEFCKDYLTDECDEIVIHTSQQDIDRERLYNADPEYVPRDYPDSYLELLAIYRKIAELMPARDTLLIHGSAISYDGEGVMFLADSGTGKSTHSSHWLNEFSSHVCMINDDKPLIRVTDDGAVVYGTPWSGKRGLNTNIKAPLKVMYKLSRSDTPCTCSMNENDIWKILMEQTYRCETEEGIMKTVELIGRLVGRVTVRGLQCNKSPESAKTALKDFSQYKN